MLGRRGYDAQISMPCTVVPLFPQNSCPLVCRLRPATESRLELAQVVRFAHFNLLPFLRADSPALVGREGPCSRRPSRRKPGQVRPRHYCAEAPTAGCTRVKALPCSQRHQPIPWLNGRRRADRGGIGARRGCRACRGYRAPGHHCPCGARHPCVCGSDRRLDAAPRRAMRFVENLGALFGPHCFKLGIGPC